MDPVKVQKFRAMAKYKKTHFLRKLACYTVTAIMAGLFLSSPLWLSPLCLFIKSCLCVSLSNMIAYILRPKFLFLLSNIIVVVLVGESKFLGTSNPKPDLYDEYVKRKKGSQKLSVPAAAQKETTHCYEEKSVIEKSVVKVRSKEDQEKDEMEKNVEDEDEEEEFQTEKGGQEEEEDCELPVDELNRRVEDFIARINRQRRLEAKLLICKG